MAGSSEEGTTPRQRRHARTRQEILDAALAIIDERGADALSLRGVARRADYSPAGLYEYFDGKEAIAAAVCDDGFARLARRMDAVPEALPPRERLQRLGEAYLRFAREHPQHFRFVFTTPMEEHARRGADDHGTFETLRRAVADAQAAGAIPGTADLDSADLAFGFWSLVHGMATLRARALQAKGGAPREADAVLARLLRLWVEGVVRPVPTGAAAPPERR